MLGSRFRLMMDLGWARLTSKGLQNCVIRVGIFDRERLWDMDLPGEWWQQTNQKHDFRVDCAHIKGVWRWGSERTWILSGIYYARHFIQFVLEETTQLVGSNPSVMFTGEHIASARAGLRAANAECLILSFQMNLTYVSNVRMWRSSRFRFVYFIGACKKSAAAQ